MLHIDSIPQQVADSMHGFAVIEHMGANPYIKTAGRFALLFYTLCSFINDFISFKSFIWIKGLGCGIAVIVVPLQRCLQWHFSEESYVTSKTYMHLQP